MTRDPTTDPDPRGLIRESYAIEDITEAECRSIFLDWVLGVPEGAAVAELAAALLARHGAAGHPMTAILAEAAAGRPARAARRGGRGARRAGTVRKGPAPEGT
ncbi:MAG: hypothetical protein D6688_10580 [Alphaproteobacteria bacterium]|nr:MAG: hypothetical protein D6688_10580 [Alphaproteobacteria bacterium]